ncbi:MAG: hypothetical protein PVI57_01585 [Gemmatimonadota bacterium]|jgi:hypothetical protein
MDDEGRRNGGKAEGMSKGVPGIVIADGREWTGPTREPRITAFIWGGKVRPTPTLPFGRWKGAA